MEIVAICAAFSIVSLLGVSAWVYVRIEQHKIQYQNPERIEALEAELKRQAAIVNKLDQEGLEYVIKKVDVVAGKLKDVAIGNILRGS